jgi:hypothetical protein
LVKAQYAPMDQKWGISFTPTIIRTPTIQYAAQFGAEYRINQRLYLLTEFAIPIGHANKDSSAFDRKYFRIKPELKYMLPHGSRRFHEYVAVQLSYSFRKFRHAGEGSYFDNVRTDTIAIAFSSADVKSPISTASLLYGIDIWPMKKFFVEMYAGMGIRNINTHYINVENAHTVQYYQPVDKMPFSIDDANDFNASIYRFHLSFGLRLVYRFSNN